MFTKAFGRELFLRHRDVLLGIPPSGPLREFLEKTKRMYYDKRTFKVIDKNLHQLVKDMVSDEE
jgi:hypothetical protein